MTFLRSAFFVGSGTRKDRTLKNEDANFFVPFFSQESFARCGETNLQVPQVPQGCLPFGRGSSAGCVDDFEGYKGCAFSGTSGAGRSEIESEGSLHDLPNSLVAVGSANAVGDMDIDGACGEHDLDGHVVEFENLQPAVFAEYGYLHCLHSMNSFICHPSMRAPSLTRVIDGTSGGFARRALVRGLEVCCEGVALHGWMFRCTM